jgi:hypothetical protein
VPLIKGTPRGLLHFLHCRRNLILPLLFDFDYTSLVLIVPVCCFYCYSL